MVSLVWLLLPGGGFTGVPGLAFDAEDLPCLAVSAGGHRSSLTVDAEDNRSSLTVDADDNRSSLPCAWCWRSSSWCQGSQVFLDLVLVSGVTGLPCLAVCARGSQVFLVRQLVPGGHRCSLSGSRCQGVPGLPCTAVGAWGSQVFLIWLLVPGAHRSSLSGSWCPWVTGLPCLAEGARGSKVFLV